MGDEEKEEFADDESAGFRTIGHERVDERFINVLKSTVLGVYITVKIRTADLDTYDPFRARINLRSLYLIELMLRCIKLLGGLPAGGANPRLTQQYTLRRFIAAVTHTLRDLTIAWAPTPSQDVQPKPSPSKKMPVFRLSKEFQKKVLNFSKVPSSFDRDDTKRKRAMHAYETLNAQMRGKNAPYKVKKATERLGVLAIHLDRMRKLCQRVVFQFYEDELGAVVQVEDKAEEVFRRAGDDILDLQEIVKDFDLMVRYVDAYEEWTKKFETREKSRNMRDLLTDGYVDNLRGFLQLSEWKFFSPMYQEFIRYDGKWRPDLEFEPSQD